MYYVLELIMELHLTPDYTEEFSPERRRANPTRVLTASLGEKIGVVLGVPVSCYALFSLAVFPPRPQPIGLALGLLCALFCSLALFVFCWSAVFAYFIRKYNLSPTQCRWAGMPFLLLAIPTFVVEWFSSGRHVALSALFIVTAMLTANACQRLAYPANSIKQVNNSEPRPPGVF